VRAVSGKYKSLRVGTSDGSVKFVDGGAEVTESQAEVLRALPEHFEVTIEGALEEPKKLEVDDGGGDGAPEEPKGNAALDEWQAYAVSKGIPAENVADLKREEIKQLLAE